jgi:hypothetical protein
VPVLHRQLVEVGLVEPDVGDDVVLDVRQVGGGVLLGGYAEEDRLRRVRARAAHPQLSEPAFVEEPVRHVGYLEAVRGECMGGRLKPRHLARAEAFGVALLLVRPEQDASAGEQRERGERCQRLGRLGRFSQRSSQRA